MSLFKTFLQRFLPLALVLLWGGATAQAQNAAPFPAKAVTLVVPFPAGGGPDLAARVMAEKLAQRWGQAVVIDNKPGAGALLGAAQVARSAADGHTLLFTPNTMVISPHVLAAATAGVDVHKDLVPVISPATTPMVLVASPSLGVRTLGELVELAKKQPGVAYGSPGNGSPMHFAGEMFKRSAKVDLLHVPYRGVAPSLNAALAGEVKLLFTGVGGALQHIKAGKLLPLALTESKRSGFLPDVPTAGEQGVPQVEVNAWYGVFAPAATPAAVVTRVNQDMNAVLQMPDVREKLLQAGLEPLGGAPQVLAGFMKADDQRYGQLARDLKIKAD